MRCSGSHGTRYRYDQERCRCDDCVIAERVRSAMARRRQRSGSWYLKHDGRLEQRYPEAVEAWIRRKRR